MQLPELLRALRQLGLGGMAESLEARLVQAQADQLPVADFLALLVQDELTRRADRLLTRRVKEAAFRDPDKTLAGFGSNCLLARRLLERGVRFVLLCNGAYAMGEGVGNWDGHKQLKIDYDRHGPILDQPVAALLRDLRERLANNRSALAEAEQAVAPAHAVLADVLGEQRELGAARGDAQTGLVGAERGT